MRKARPRWACVMAHRYCAVAASPPTSSKPRRWPRSKSSIASNNFFLPPPTTPRPPVPPMPAEERVMNHAPLLWHNGHIKPWADATVHVSAHALHYGSSVFEGERVYATPKGPAYFRLADHTRRLFESARVYEIEVGYSEDEINAACLELIRANAMPSAYVRPIVFRGAVGLGVLARDGAPVEVAIIALNWGAYLGEAAERGAD